MFQTIRTTLALVLAGTGLAAPGGSAIQAPMLGSWLYGTLSSIEYYDRSTSKWQDASGASELVTFLPDGRYERTRLLSLTTFSCTSKLFIYEKGTVRIEGNTLTYRPKEGVNKGYTCTPSNSWSTTRLKAETWTFSFERGSNGQDVLVLKGQADSAAHYSRYQR
jgi:hypothetical protein